MCWRLWRELKGKIKVHVIVFHFMCKQLLKMDIIHVKKFKEESDNKAECCEMLSSGLLSHS